jgi:hypothetical protein
MESAKQLQPFADEAKRFRPLRSPCHCKQRGFRNAASIGLPRLALIPWIWLKSAHGRHFSDMARCPT